MSNTELNNILVTHNWKDITGLCFIQLNRPKQLNALNTDTLKEIVEVLESNQKKIKCAIITGNEKSFSAGADIKQLATLNAIDHYRDERETLWKKFRLLPFPIISGVSGFCFGGGHELSMACDMTIASDNAQFGQPEIKLGIIPGAGGTQRLTKALGKSKAMYYTMTGETFGAKFALDNNLISKIVPKKALNQELYQLGKTLCSFSSHALRLIKESINQSFETGLTQSLDFERRQFYLSFASEDSKEGLNAFIEKRTPEYQGR